MILVNEGHLGRVLQKWVAHYNRARPHSSLVPRQYRGRPKTIDVGIVAGHATRDASRHPNSHGDRTRLVDASRPAARGPCPAPPVGRPGAVQPALSPI